MEKRGKLELTWVGKYQDEKLEPRILIEDITKSYGDSDTENMLIHGDNLLALKALENDYAGKIKCVYIDPPYNTGNAFEHYDDDLSESIFNKQKLALENMPEMLTEFDTYTIALRSYNITGIDSIRNLLKKDQINEQKVEVKGKLFNLDDVVSDLVKNNRKVIFTMGKGGVGKTTIASSVALKLSKLGKKVHLATTDPADHIKFMIDSSSGISMSHIDEKKN